MKQSFGLSLLPQEIVQKKHEMGTTYHKIASWSLKMHCGLVGILVCAGWIAVQTSMKGVACGLVLSVVLLRALMLFNVRQAYQGFRDARNVEFLYFFSLLVPHLSQAVGVKTGLYRILTKLEIRLEDQSILKQGVNRLVIQMTNHPGNIEPFLEFARLCSGTELAEDVAVALFDFQQNSDDQEAINRLKDKVNKALDKRMEDVVTRKISRFRWYSSRVVMSVFVLILGILGTSIWAEIMRAFSVIK
ncbi:hypothetical protein AOC36_02050 [Erysipelothrix larvae]|uniref:Type II secretion system protein GspF domain-containing protein n=1 Tax=Erysipelothrix larvae TaxID=1514105 RepID=A0A109UGL6_9FIRM|nr:hypothetical protein [Erysipelothrix larvae]AMC92808.1 hypothetical protein AOC36_02050 [Erysipelothrix larvae]